MGVDALEDARRRVGVELGVLLAGGSPFWSSKLGPYARRQPRIDGNG
jgi:hypothetical protein